MTIMFAKNERRKRSIRSLPLGQFDKYLQMFDNQNEGTNFYKNSNESNNKKSTKPTNLFYEEEVFNNTNSKQNMNESNEFLEMPYTDDEKKSYLKNYEGNNIKHNRMFHGLSDETHTMLNTLCSSNEEIASFFVDKNEPKKIPIKRFTQEYEWYQAIPINTVSDEYNDIKELVSLENKNLDDLSTMDSTTNSLESKFNRLHLNEADFSDDSYDETDEYSNQGFEIKLSVLRLHDNEDDCKLLI